MDHSKNFHDTIKELEQKLGQSLDSLVDTNVKYRSAQDHIDKLNLIIFESKAQIMELTYSLNDLLKKLDLSMHLINLDDLKKCNNAEALRLINNAFRFIAAKF